MIKKTIALLLVTATACTPIPILKNNSLMQCRLELYCNNTENSLLKKTAFKALSIYFKSDISPTLCEKYYQSWGMDYRKTAQERCGKKGDFNIPKGSWLIDKKGVSFCFKLSENNTVCSPFPAQKMIKIEQNR